MRSDRVIKLTVAACLVLITVAVVAAWNAPATGYESSIYSATPVLFWVLIGFSIVSGIVVIVHQLYTGQHETSRLWTLGLLVVVVGYTAILSLHIIRGYAYWGTGDATFHLGEIQNIVGTGFIAGDSFYPAATVLAAQLSRICSVDPLVFHKVLPVIFVLLCVASMYLLARLLLPHKGAAILVTIASMPAIWGIHGAFSYPTFTPNGFANLLFPMTFFLLFKSFGAGAWRWRALLILVSLLFPVFHPVPTVALAVVFVTLPLAKALLDKVEQSPRPVFFDRSFKVSLVALAVLLVWGGGWIGSFPATQRTLGALVADDYSISEPAPDPDPAPDPVPNIDMRPPPYTLETAPEPPRVTGRIAVLAGLLDDIRYTQAYGYSAVQHIFNLYGVAFLYMILALLAFAVLWRRNRLAPDFKGLISLYGPLAGIALVMIALLFTGVGFHPHRFLLYVVLLCVFFVGFVLYEVLERVRIANPRLALSLLAPVLVTLILLAAYGNALSKLYPAPHILADNQQGTRTEITAMDWLFDRKDRSLDIIAHERQLGRFGDFLLTREEREQRPDVPRRHVPSPPSHFGYHEGLWLGEHYDQATYMVLGERDRLRYVEVYPALAMYRYHPEDYDRLEGDPTMDKLYSNGGLDVYYIHGVGQGHP